jgi:hypothetical protein
MDENVTGNVSKNDQNVPKLTQYALLKNKFNVK